MKRSIMLPILLISLLVCGKLFCDIQELSSGTNCNKKKSKISNPEATSCYKNSFLVEYKPAYFYYQDHTFRRLFNDGGFLSIFGFDVKAYKNLHIWLDTGYLYDKGKVKKADYAKTTISLVPISSGLKYQCIIVKVISPYFKLGLNQFYIKNKNYYPYVDREVTKHYFGFTIGTGCLIDLYKGLSINLFIDYLFNKRKFISPDSNLPIKVYVGGMAFGAGVGYQF